MGNNEVPCTNKTCIFPWSRDQGQDQASEAFFDHSDQGRRLKKSIRGY